MFLFTILFIHMKLSQAKTYGGIGVILSLIGGVIPYAGSIVSIIGIVLLLIAVKYIADETKNKNIFSNYLIAFILAIVAIIIAIVSFIAFVGIDVLLNLRNLRRVEDIIALRHIVAGLIFGIIIFWVIYLISAIFVKKSYYAIAEHTKVDLFHTTGLLYLIGAATLIILIGVFIILIAKILEIIAYFSLPEELPKIEKSQESI